MRTLILASALLLVANPAFAWEFAGDNVKASATQAGGAADYALQVECEPSAADHLGVVFTTAEHYDDMVVYPKDVAMTITVDDKKYELAASYKDADGMVAIVATAGDTNDLQALVASVGAAKTQIRVSVPSSKAQRFGVDNASAAIAAFEKACGIAK